MQRGRLCLLICMLIPFPLKESASQHACRRVLLSMVKNIKTPHHVQIVLAKKVLNISCVYVRLIWNIKTSYLSGKFLSIGILWQMLSIRPYDRLNFHLSANFWLNSSKLLNHFAKEKKHKPQWLHPRLFLINTKTFGLGLGEITLPLVRVTKAVWLDARLPLHANTSIDCIGAP